MNESMWDSAALYTIPNRGLSWANIGYTFMWDDVYEDSQRLSYWDDLCHWLSHVINHDQPFTIRTHCKPLSAMNLP